MGYKRRQQQKLAALAVEDFYESPSGNPEAWGEVGSVYPVTDFPGSREINVFNDAENFRTFMYDPGVIRDQVDWAIGGVPGFTKFIGSDGPVNPYTVDAHEFKGMMQTVRRMPDTNYGPVVTSDHNSILQMLYAMQESAHYFPNEVSQADVIRAV